MPEPPPDPRQAHLMSVTEQLVAKHGFDRLRLRDVANEAGVSVGSIQHWFASREDLLLATLTWASWRRAEEFTASQEGLADPVDRVHALLSGSIAERARCHEWLETCVSSTRHPQLSPMIERIYEAWRSVLQQAIEDGVTAGAFDPVLPVSEVVDQVMVMIDGLMVAVALHLYDRDAPYVTRLMEESTGRLLRYDFSRRTATRD